MSNVIIVTEEDIQKYAEKIVNVLQEMLKEMEDIAGVRIKVAVIPTLASTLAPYSNREVIAKIGKEEVDFILFSDQLLLVAAGVAELCKRERVTGEEVELFRKFIERNVEYAVTALLEAYPEEFSKLINKIARITDLLLTHMEELRKDKVLDAAITTLIKELLYYLDVRGSVIQKWSMVIGSKIAGELPAETVERMLKSFCACDIDYYVEVLVSEIRKHIGDIYNAQKELLKTYNNLLPLIENVIEALIDILKRRKFKQLAEKIKNIYAE